MRIRDIILKSRNERRGDKLKELIDSCVEVIMEMEDFNESQYDVVAYKKKIESWSIRLSYLELLRKELENATEKRKIERDNIREHRGADSLWPPIEASGGNILLQSGEVKEEKSKKARKKKKE
jgi:hypothetical protein